jgi:hypothetical protein
MDRPVLDVYSVLFLSYLTNVFTVAFESMVHCGSAFEPGPGASLLLHLHMCVFLLYLARYMCGFKTIRKKKKGNTH